MIAVRTWYLGDNAEGSLILTGVGARVSDGFLQKVTTELGLKG